MSKTQLTPDLVASLLAASPEGFFNKSHLHRYTDSVDSIDTVVAEAVQEGRIGSEGDFIYDSARLTVDDIRQRSALFSGSTPELKRDGTPAARPIAERIKSRETKLRELNDPVLKR